MSKKKKYVLVCKVELKDDKVILKDVRNAPPVIVEHGVKYENDKGEWIIP